MAATKNLEDDFSRLGLFIGTVLAGLAILTFLILPVVYFAFVRKNPFRFLFTMIEPVLITIAASSTAVAMPATIRQLEGPNNVNPKVSRFICPLNAAIGRCGSCLYICCACLFVMQTIDKEMEVATVILVCILTTFSSLAIAAVPSASLVSVVIMLTALSIPPEAASLLYAFEWFLDRMRAACNNFVQGLCGVVTNRVCESSLKGHEASEEYTNAYEINVVPEKPEHTQDSSKTVLNEV